MYSLFFWCQFIDLVVFLLLMPGGGGGGTAIYELSWWATDGLYRYVPLSRAWFSSSFLWDRVYKSESLGLESGIIFQETDQLVEGFSID